VEWKAIDARRKVLNRNQSALRGILTGGEPHAARVDAFLLQHAGLHAAEVGDGLVWSLADAVLDGLPDELVRRLPRPGAHSVAWLVWHMARCEDITMNQLVAGTEEVLHTGGWLAKTRSPVRDTANTMDDEAVAAFSQAVDWPAVRAYRAAVGRQTRAVVGGLAPGALEEKVDPSRLPQLFESGAVLPESAGLVKYWSQRTTAGLLLMPATRHNLTHLNEALGIRKSG
jgi:hypothetical protein